MGLLGLRGGMGKDFCGNGNKGEGGLTRCARPAGSPLAGSRPVQLAAPVVAPRSGVLIPPWWALHTKKSSHVNANSSFKDGGEGGLTRCARPAGSPACGWSVQLAAPVVEPRSGVLIPPWWVLHTKKSSHVNANSSFINGGEGGIDSLRSPCGQSARRLTACPTGCTSCRTPVGGSHPPLVGATYKKEFARECELFF